MTNLIFFLCYKRSFTRSRPFYHPSNWSWFYNNSTMLPGINNDMHLTTTPANALIEIHDTFDNFIGNLLFCLFTEVGIHEVADLGGWLDLLANFIHSAKDSHNSSWIASLLGNSPTPRSTQDILVVTEHSCHDHVKILSYV